MPLKKVTGAWHYQRCLRPWALTANPASVLRHLLKLAINSLPERRRRRKKVEPFLSSPTTPSLTIGIIPLNYILQHSVPPSLIILDCLFYCSLSLVLLFLDRHGTIPPKIWKTYSSGSLYCLFILPLLSLRKCRRKTDISIDSVYWLLDGRNAHA